MFLRFFILLLSFGFITACGMSGSEEEMEMEITETQDETATTVVVECKCERDDSPPTVKGEGDTRRDAIFAAKEKCSVSNPNPRAVKVSKLGECKILL
ncbi:MAG: hypothetical protein OXC37_02160 [Bdellovibrionaceae bacterium]|nr:hypothetical protein [Pseudobdellovibrionaceae bacterium]